MCNRYALKIKMFYCMTSSVDQKLKKGQIRQKIDQNSIHLLDLLGNPLKIRFSYSAG